MTSLRATYRLQFNAGFRFADGAALAPYLAALGVSHVYASPIFAARAGSTHGYDITDYNRLNPELGSDADFRAMVAALRAHGLGLILDFVPNHMGIGGADNAYWESVLEWGPDSPYAHWFDIDWQAPGLEGKVLFPFLGKSCAEVLDDGGLTLRLDDGGRLAVWAHDTHRLPICPRDYALVLDAANAPLAADFRAMRDAPPNDPRWPGLHAQLAAAGADLAAFDDPARLGALIARQHWRASRFNLDADAINYRRFFTISDLAGVRVECPRVFDETHALVVSLVREGLVDGLRIDHIDGLRDPKAYCLRLRAAVGRPFSLHVEKILGPDEQLPADWNTDGTTGYEFANDVVCLLADPAGAAALDTVYHEVTAHTAPAAHVVHTGKLAVLAGPMRAEREALLHRFSALARAVPEWSDLGVGAIREGLAQTIAALDIYRPYADADGIAPDGRARIMAALAHASQAAPELDPAIWDLLAQTLTLDLRERLPASGDDILEAAMRFQQLSGPVMAKGLEDRALYRFNRLIALNEVGAHPGCFGLPVEDFHARQQARLAQAPQTLLATSSHDTKRGEDARMRIVTIASHTGLWRQKVAEWRTILDDSSAPVDPNEGYFFFQLLTGVWPDTLSDPPTLEARVTDAMLKSVREAGVNTRWVFGDDGYENRVRALVHRALASSAFVSSFSDFIRRIRPQAEASSLIQTALKLTVPGVPDIYQGAEMWDQSLVDPDNRRPVDFAHRAGLLPELTAGAPFMPDRPADQVKLALIAALLKLRADHPALFSEGAYLPLKADGPAATGFLGYIRRAGGARVLVAAALHPASHDQNAWSDTRILLPNTDTSTWRNLLDGAHADPRNPADLFRHLPLAILRPD